jgi:hypothetical protein
MEEFTLDRPEWMIFSAVFLIQLAAESAGRFIGRRSATDEASLFHFAGIQTGMLGLLGLLFGFTFSMALERYDTRKELLVTEANGIGTAFLRAELIGQPERSELQRLLRAYIETRLQFYSAKDQTEYRRVNAESARLHSELWRQAMRAAERQPTPTTALLVSALNDVIDLHGTQVAALDNHVPALVLWMLLVVATLCAAITGQASGFARGWNRAPSIGMLMLIAGVSSVIVDLERPRWGLIRTGQVSMLELQQSLQQTAPDQP